MSSAPHISDVARPVVGETYQVPCVWHRDLWFPVLGPHHADEELLVGYQHYHFDYRFFTTELDQFFAGFYDDESRRTASGHACPHRGFDLRCVAAKNGVLECPLHGLRIDAKTRRVVPRDP